MWLSIYLSIGLSICVSVFLSIYLSFFLSFYLSVSLAVYLSSCLSSSLKENLAIVRDFLEIDKFEGWKTKLFKETSFKFGSWQHQKRSNSARLPSKVEVDNITNAAILRDFLQLGSWQHQTRSNSARLPSKMESRVLTSTTAPVAKKWGQVIRSAAPVTQKKLRKAEDLMLQNAGNLLPLQTCLIPMSLVLRLPREMHLYRSSSNVSCLLSFLRLLQNPHVLLTFGKVQNPLRLPRKIALKVTLSKSGPSI